MTKTSYKGDVQDYIKKLFSEDYIKHSKQATEEFIERLLEGIAIEKRKKKIYRS